MVIFLVAEESASVAHQLVLIVSPFLTFEHVTMDFGDHGMGVRNTVMDIGNHGVGVRNTMMDIGNNSMGAYCELGLHMNSQQ